MAKGPQLPRINDYLQPPVRDRVAGVVIERPTEVSEEERRARSAAFDRRLDEMDALPPVERSDALPGLTKATAEGPQVQMIPLHRLTVSPWNARPSHLDVDALQKLIVVISRAGGVRAPIHVYPEEESDFYAIIDGQRRFNAALALNLATLPCIVHERKEAARLYAMSFGLSDTGERPSALDNALMWARLKEEGVVSGARQIAELVGVNETSVSRTLLFFTLDESIQKRLQASPTSRFHTIKCFITLDKVQKELGTAAVREALDLLETTNMPFSAVLGKLKSSKRKRQVRAVERRPLLYKGKTVGSLRYKESMLTMEWRDLEDNPLYADRILSTLENMVQSLLESEQPPRTT